MNCLKPGIKIIILLFLLISAFFLPRAVLLYSGYCFEKNGYLSTQEKFNIVATWVINEQKASGDRRLTFVHPEPGWRRAYTVNEAGGKIFLNEAVEITFRYSSLEEFYALNPDGCEFVEMFFDEGKKYDVPFLSRVNGHLNILVRVFYIYDFDQDNDMPLYRERYFGLSNCGKLLTQGDIVRLHEPEW